MNQRAHPTVRPYALALGVVPRRGVEEQLSFLGPAAAQDLASALLLDTLGALLLAVGFVSAEEAEALAVRLLAVPGVVEAVVVAEEGVAYLKVDAARLDEGALGALDAAGA